MINNERKKIKIQFNFLLPGLGETEKLVEASFFPLNLRVVLFQGLTDIAMVASNKHIVRDFGTCLFYFLFFLGFLKIISITD